MSTVVTRGARSGGLSIISSLIAMILQFGSVVVLSRLLLPEDFGVVAMVQVFVMLGELIKDLGISSSALQQKSLTHQQSSNLFWVNVCISLMAFVVLVLATPLVVGFYKEPRLAAIIPALGSSLVINGATAQIRIHLSRELRFRPVIVNSIAGTAIGVASAIAVGLMGGGYWALVLQKVATSGGILAIVWIAAKWVPFRFRRGHSTRRLIVTGLHYWVGGLFNLINSNMTNVVIGRTFSATELGFYNRANHLASAIVEYLVGPLRQIVVPTLNRQAVAGSGTRMLMRRVQFVVAFGVVGILAAAGSVADVLIPTVLGLGWDNSIGMFRILVVAASFQVFIDILFWVMMFVERSRSSMIWNALSAATTVVLVLAGATFGLPGILGGYVLGRALSWLAGLVILSLEESVPARELFWDGVAVLACGLLSVIVSMEIWNGVLIESPIFEIALGATTCFATFTGLLIVLPSTRKHLRVLSRLIVRVAHR